MSQNPLPQCDLPVTLAEVLSAELAQQRPHEARAIDKKVKGALENTSIWAERKKASTEIVPDIYAAIHGLKEKRSALCLSVDGVRQRHLSNLGVLQGLARSGLLERFDYLSTVSGGGFHRQLADGMDSSSRYRRQNVVAPLAALRRTRSTQSRHHSTTYVFMRTI